MQSLLNPLHAHAVAPGRSGPCMKHLFTRHILSIVCFILVFTMAAPSAVAAVNLPADAYITLPLSRGKQNQLLLKLPANGRSALLALDTGSPVTCLDESKAKLFNLAPTSTDSSPPEGLIVNGTRHRIATVPLLLFGNMQVRDVPVVLIDLTDLNQVLRSRHDKANDAILGLDTMHDLGAIIDCGSDRLLLREKDDDGQFGAMLKRSGWHEISMHLNEGHLVVNGFVQHVPVQFIVDTGSPVTVLDQDFCKAHRITLSDKSFGLKAIHFETSAAKIGKVYDLQIGRLLLGQSLVAVFNVTTLLRTNPAAGNNEPRALLGSRTLARTQAFIDCDKMKLYLKAPVVERDWGF